MILNICYRHRNEMGVSFYLGKTQKCYQDKPRIDAHGLRIRWESMGLFFQKLWVGGPRCCKTIQRCKYFQCFFAIFLNKILEDFLRGSCFIPYPFCIFINKILENFLGVPVLSPTPHATCASKKPRDGKCQKTENANLGFFVFFSSVQANVSLSRVRIKLPDIKLEFFKVSFHSFNL